MNDVPARPEPAPSADPRATVNARAALLSDRLVLTVKLLGHTGARLFAPVPGVERAAFSLLFRLSQGSMRVSELAQAVHSDASTVSRQIAALTERGLVEKSADPADRRSQVLSLTDAGRRAVAERVEQRRALFSQVLQDWDDQDVENLSRLLERFCDDLSAWSGTALP